ncbi:LOW QUALITY PROTEIN: hypothetical protein Nmel_010307 [Mimus melanotis]
MLGPVVSSQPAAKCHSPVNTSQIKVMQGPQTPGKVPASQLLALGQFPCVALVPFQGEARSPHPTNCLEADLQPVLSELTPSTSVPRHCDANPRARCCTQCWSNFSYIKSNNASLEESHKDATEAAKSNTLAWCFQTEQHKQAKLHRITIPVRLGTATSSQHPRWAHSDPGSAVTLCSSKTRPYVTP